MLKPTQPHPLFVYGSLLSGFFNSRDYLTDKVAKRETAYFSGTLYHLPEGYPALLAGSDEIIGELVYLKDFANISAIDELEEYFGENHPDNLYCRQLVQEKKLMAQTNQPISISIIERSINPLGQFIYLVETGALSCKKITSTRDNPW